MLFCVLFGKRNEYMVPENLDAEGRKPLLHFWIGEAIHLVKIAIEHVNGTIAEVRRVKKSSINIRTDRETLVDRAVMRMINGKNSGAAVIHSGVPTRNSAILGREDKTRGGGYAAACNIEAGSRNVEHVSRGGRGCRLVEWGRDRD
jgi:hypothetical protein